GTARLESDREKRGTSNSKRRPGVTNRRRAIHAPARLLRTHSGAVAHVPLARQTLRPPALWTRLRTPHPALPALRSLHELPPHHPISVLVVEYESSGANQI